MALLRVEQGIAPGKLLPLTVERTVLGRHPNSDIVLENEAVSREHARILEENGRFFVEDLQSRNGTEINGVTIADKTELCDGDLITICSVRFSFYLQSPPDDGGPEIGIDPAEDSSSTRVAPAGSDLWSGRLERGSVIDPDSSAGNGDLSSSSIITTLKASGGDSSSWRLTIRPEAKLQAILKITQALGTVLDAEAVLDTVLEQLFEIFPQAEQGCVLRKDADRGQLVVAAIRTRESAECSGNVHVSMTIIRQALQSGEAILSANALEDSRFEMSESLSELQIRSLVCVPLLKSSGEPLGVLQLDTRNARRQFDHEDLEVLVSVASQVSLAVENAELHETLVQQEVFERELQSARRIQMGLLPQQRPRLRDYGIFDYYQPARTVGGDYFDYIALPDGRLAIAIGDVAGKGIPAALWMARLYSATRSHLFSTNGAASALAALNAEIDVDAVGHRFITFLIAILDPERNEVTVANAGHLPILQRSPDGSVSRLGFEYSGLPLGIDPTQTFREMQASVKDDAVLLLHTDGVTDAMNADHETFTRERVETYLAGCDGDAESITKGLIREVRHFQGNVSQADDLCVVCLTHAC